MAIGEKEVELAVLSTKVDNIEHGISRLETSVQGFIEESKLHLDGHIVSLHERLDMEAKTTTTTHELRLAMELERLRNEIHTNTETRIRELDSKTVERFKEIKVEFRLWLGSMITVIMLVGSFFIWESERRINIEQPNEPVADIKAVVNNNTKLILELIRKMEEHK